MFEPPSVNGSKPLRLLLQNSQLTIPGINGEEDVTVYTRSYGMLGIKSAAPGPTIRVKPGDVLRVTLENLLASPDPDCTDSGSDFYCYPNTTNLHTHGLHVSPRPGADDIFEGTGPQEKPGLRFAFPVPDFHMPGLFWYHAHHHHSTALQAGGGAVGALVVEDPEGTLPAEVAGMPEVLAVITYVDASFIAGLEGESGGSDWQTNSDFAGALVNGMYMPETEVTAGVWHRFRIVFASIRFVLEIAKIGEAHCDFQLLAKDGVYLQTAPRRIDRIYLGSGNRADVAVRCTCPPGKKECEMYLKTAEGNETLANDRGLSGGMTARSSPFHGIRQLDMVRGTRKGTREMGVSITNRSGIIDQYLFKVNVVPGESERPEPDLKPFQVARPCYLVDLRDADRVGTVESHTLGLQTPIPGVQDGLLSLDGNGKSFKTDDRMVQPPMANLTLPSLQEWVVGPTGAIATCGTSCHPFHLHVTPFQLLNLTVEDSYFQNGDWHDTFIHGVQADIAVRFQLSSFTGDYVTHCHLLQHEDEGMMNYVNVSGAEGQTWQPAKLIDPKCYNSAAARNHLENKFTYV